MLTDKFLVTDQVAIVTGAGRGIGRATALTLAEAGADVVITSRTKEQLEDVAREVAGRGRRAAVVVADVSDTTTLPSLIDAAVSEFGRLDIVVNNAGGTEPGTLSDTSEAIFEAAFHFNVSTAFSLTKLAVPHMLETGGGSVVNISSTMGRFSARGFSAYATAKGALSHLTRQLAQDLAPRIRVNALEVGSTATSALEVVLTEETILNMMVDGTPMRRLGDPDEIALAVLYLTSPAASFITGICLPIDGGITHPNFDMGLPDL